LPPFFARYRGTDCVPNSRGSRGFPSGSEFRDHASACGGKQEHRKTNRMTNLYHYRTFLIPHTSHSTARHGTAHYERHTVHDMVDDAFESDTRFHRGVHRENNLGAGLVRVRERGDRGTQGCVASDDNSLGRDAHRARTLLERLDLRGEVSSLRQVCVR